MPRRADIDAAKALAILLVVFGHLVARADPLGVDWYEPLRRAVYAFHMPFFLYLSGLIAVESGLLRLGWADLPALARRRALRLLVPFFGLGVLITAGKCAAARFVHVDNAPASFGAGLLSLVWHTAQSPSLTIWYLVVLFVVSLMSVALLRGEARRLPVLLLVCLALNAVPLPRYLYLDRIGQYAIFFALGAWAGVAGARWSAWMDRNWPVCLSVFLPGLVLVMIIGPHLPPTAPLLPIGMLSMPALHGWLRSFGSTPPGWLLKLGRYVFMIYLFNTLFIGAAKALLLKFVSWDGAHFLPFAAALMCAGLAGPVWLKKTVFRHVPVLDRLTN